MDDKSNLNIYVNSGGGSVFAGLAIYNMLKRNKAQKLFMWMVLRSIASVIALAGDRVVVPSNAFLMIHKPWTYALEMQLISKSKERTLITSSQES